MPLIEPYLTFDGNCAEAMHFYEKTLGGTLETMMTHAQSPMAEKASAANRDRIMHARLLVDGKVIMASDTLDGHPWQGSHGFALSLTYPSEAEARKMFDALAAGGKVDMPMQATFWTSAFGMLKDRFGVSWMIGVAGG